MYQHKLEAEGHLLNSAITMKESKIVATKRKLMPRNKEEKYQQLKNGKSKWQRLEKPYDKLRQPVKKRRHQTIEEQFKEEKQKRIMAEQKLREKDNLLQAKDESLRKKDIMLDYKDQKLREKDKIIEDMCQKLREKDEDKAQTYRRLGEVIDNEIRKREEAKRKLQK